LRTSLSHIDTTLHVVSCLSVSLPLYKIHSHVFSLSRCVSLSHGKRDKQRHKLIWLTHFLGILFWMKYSLFLPPSLTCHPLFCFSVILISFSLLSMCNRYTYRPSVFRHFLSSMSYDVPVVVVLPHFLFHTCHSFSLTLTHR